MHFDKRFIVSAFVFIHAIMGAGLAQANLLTNGSFESPTVPSGSYPIQFVATGEALIPGWSVVGASGNVGVTGGTFSQFGLNFPSQAGSQWLDLTGYSNTATGVQQTVSTTAGIKYELTFWVGNVAGSIFGETSTVQVLVNGTQVLAAQNTAVTTTQEWQRFRVTFTATGPTSTITFLNADPYPDNHNGLDNAVLMEAPPSVLDFNADGKTDFLWRYTPTGALAYWIMDGVTITGGGGITTLSTDWQFAGTPDLNDDGKADMLWRHTPTGAVAYWIMNGTSIASLGYIGTVDTDWRIAGTADFNRDGKPDLLWQHTPTGTVAVWYMDGTAMTSSAVITSVGTDWQVAGAPDLNGDGKPDILWRQVSTGLVAYWLMDGITIQSGGGIMTVPSNWHIVGTPDLNGDGKPDILWHDTTTGTVSYWYMTGDASTIILGGGAVTAVPAGWDIIAPR